MILARLGAALVLAAVTTLAAAQGASAPTAAKKALVAKVLQLQHDGIEGLGNQIAAQTVQQLAAAVNQALERVSADKREAVAKDVQGDLRKFFDEIAPSLRASAVKLAPGVIGGALDERFSEDELKTLIAWLESPVSRKYQQLSSEQSPALAQKVIADNRAAIEPKMKALETMIAKKLGLPSPAGAAPGAAAPAASAAKK